MGGFERKLDQLFLSLKRKVERGEYDEMVKGLDKFCLQSTHEKLVKVVDKKAEDSDVTNLTADLNIAKENMKEMHSRINFCEKITAKLENSVVDLKKALK